MYNNNDSKGFLTWNSKRRLTLLLRQKQVDEQTIRDFLAMKPDEMRDYYELYLADNEADLDGFYIIMDSGRYISEDVKFSDYKLPCEIKDCICYDKENNFCKSYCMDVSNLKLYDVMNCKGDEEYLKQGFAAMKEDF